MPATPSQMGHWWLHRMRRGNHWLNIPLVWMCRGNLDHSVAAAALTELVYRHESLRTTFEETADGKLSQIIHPPFSVALPLEDLRHLPKDVRQRQRDLLIHQHAHIPMDMVKGPLVSARMLQMESDENVLLLTVHRSICDERSKGVLLRDFAVIYDGLVQRVPSSLPELPIQFSDFAVWLSDWRNGSEAAESLEYWRTALGTGFTPLQIPRDFPEGSPEEWDEIETLLLAPDLMKRAQASSVAHGVTLYMLLLSVYAVTLQQWTGHSDILIGTQCSNRRVGTEDVIGPFSNLQVIRTKVEEEDSFLTVLERVREWTLGAVEHRHLPFEDLNGDEHFSLEVNQIPLDVAFKFQKAVPKTQRTSSLEIVPLRSVVPGMMFDLTLGVVELAEGSQLQLEYNPGYFRVSTIQRFLRLYLRVLEAALSDAEIPVGEYLANDQSGRPSTLPIHGEVHRNADEEAEHEHGVYGASSSHGESSDGQGGAHIEPRNDLESQVAEIWEAALTRKNLSIKDDFFSLGGTSLAAMRIASQINRTFSVDFGLATLFTGNTIERMTELVQKRLAANTHSSLVAMQPRGSGTPLFIIHGAGGNIIRFYQLAMLIGTDNPVYGIQAQSLLSGQSALLRLKDQAAYYISEIQKVQPHGPYYFLGYSFGGLTAFEMAHQLHAQGEKVELLGMLDSQRREFVRSVQNKDSVRTRFDRRLGRFFGNFIPLSSREKLEYLQEKLFMRMLRHIYQTVATLGFRSVPAFMKSTEDISWVAATNYRPKPWPGPITLFRAQIQPDSRLPWDLGWTPFAEGGVEVCELPGDHDLVFREQNIRVLAEQLRLRLQLADSDETRVRNLA